MQTIRRSLLITAAAVALCAPAAAQNAGGGRPLQIVVPYGPGNGLDLLAREYAEALRTQLGTAVVVENREGAGGIVGTTYAARAATDGQTVLFTANPPYASAPYTQSNPAYDPLTSFAPIARLGSVPMVLVTSAKSPFANFAQFKAHVRANTEGATYAHSGNGSPGLLYTELLRQAADLPALRPIPYKSTGQAMTDVIAGTVLVSMVSFPASQPFLKSGVLRLLATGGASRLAEHPDVPTLAEATGRDGFEAAVWYGALAPAGTPKEQVARLQAAFLAAQATRPLGDFMARTSIVPEKLDAAAFARALQRDVETARRAIALTGASER